ncbi:CHAD domain-containing protein [Altericista sp. CCNU0014]|uniref:CHAD domain-containing protein n=1 Tax=Altericista sp. CCNU0014 TaxID=3082949 RepID=UPI00384BDDC1
MTDEIKSNAVENASPEREKLTLGEFALASIRKHFHKSIEHEEDIFQDLDPEPLHQMRVGMRRLRTASIVFDPFVALSKDLERDIAKISKRLGRVRDLDVLGQWFQDFIADSTLDEEELSKVEKTLKRLNRQRQKQFKQMRATLQGNRYRQFVEEFQTWLKYPSFRAGAEWPIQLVLPDLLLPLIDQLLLHPGWLAAIAGPIQQWSSQVAVTDTQVEIYLAEYGPILHDLRKQIKRVRYQTEFFKGFYDSAYTEQTLEFRAIQDLLGQLQDSQVLGDFLEKAAGSDWKKAIPSLERYLQKQRLEQWQQWQPLQQKYLNPEFRQQLRALVLQPRWNIGEG